MCGLSFLFVTGVNDQGMLERHSLAAEKEYRAAQKVAVDVEAQFLTAMQQQGVSTAATEAKCRLEAARIRVGALRKVWVEARSTAQTSAQGDEASMGVRGVDVVWVQ